MAFPLAVPALAVAVSPFVDVIPGTFHEAPINWAASNGITTGKDPTHFAPNGPVTRGESVTFLKRYDDFIVQPAIAGLGTRTDGLGATVGNLACETSQVARWDGANWVCNTVGLTTRIGTDAITAVDTTGDVGRYTSIAIGNNNLPVVSYQDVSTGSLMVAHLTETVTGIAFS